MKKTFKMTMAALAAFGLASCSSDDFFGNGEVSQLQKKGDINVVVDDLIDPTTMRSAFLYNDETKKQVWQWEEKDQIRVFGSNFAKYDDYTYENGAFTWHAPNKSERQNPAVKDPSYALFSSASTQATTCKLTWDPMTDELWTTFEIKQRWDWKEITDNADGKVAYRSNLPLWGDTGYNEQDELTVNLHYLTGVLRIDLTNVPDNASMLKIKAYKLGDANGATEPAVITGKFNTILETYESGPVAGETQLDVNTASGTTGDEILVDISGAKHESTKVYIPLIAQTYGKIEVSAYADADMTQRAAEPKEINRGTAGVTVVAGGLYTMSYMHFDIAGGDIPTINDELRKRANQSEVNIRTNHQTLVAPREYTNRGIENYTLIIPKMEAGKVTLDLRGLKENTGANQSLHIIADTLGVGNVQELVLNVDAQGAGWGNKNIFVDLPNVNVTLSGAGLASTTLGSSTGNFIVKELTIGNIGEKPTEVNAAYINEDACTSVSVAEGATLGQLVLKGGAETSVEAVNVEGTINTTLDVATQLAETDKFITVTVGEKATLKAGLYTKQKELTLNGQAFIGGDGVAAGDGTGTSVKLVDGGKVIVKGVKTDDAAGVVVERPIRIYGAGSFDVQGDAKIMGLIAEEGNGKVTSVKVSGTAEIETVNTPDAAVSFDKTSQSTKNVIAKTLTLNAQSTVKDATVSGDVTIGNASTKTENVAVSSYLTMTGAEATLTLNAGYIAGMSANTLTIVNNELIQTAIKNANIKELKDYTSKWCGMTIKTTGYSNQKNIYTASHLASLSATEEVTLKANMDLDNKDWTPVELKNTFHGNNKKVLNLNAVNHKADNVGLFSTIANDKTIENLTIENATVSGKDNVGTLLGKALGKVTIENVTIQKGDGRFLTQSYESVKGSNIGGVVGAADDDATFKNVVVKNASLGGKYNIGGIIGYAAKNVTITGSQDKIVLDGINVIDAVTSIKLKGFDENAGAVGVYAGNVVGNLTVDKKHQAKGDWMKNKRRALGFKANWYSERVNGKDVYYVYYGSTTGDVGKCGNYVIAGTGSWWTKGTKYEVEEDINPDYEKAVNAYVKDDVKDSDTEEVGSLDY